MKAKKIESVEIEKLHFHSEDVLQTNGSREERNRKLSNAAILGNIEKEKCKIVFQTVEGDRYVEAIISAVTDKYICLRGGITLMIGSILEVMP